MAVGQKIPSQPSECPPVESWSDFLKGIADDETTESMALHLLGCTECVTLLEELSSHRRKTRSVALRSPYLDEDNCARMLRKALQLRVLVDEPAREVGAQRPLLHWAESIPEKFGRFVIKGVLGKGGFGQVYLADDPLLKRWVAIKAPRRGEFGTDGDLESFLNEARHAAALDHPGIVPIYDVIADESGRTLIVMKYVRGSSLSDLLRNVPLKLEQTVRLMVQVARAVHFAHELGFVHRDLKPSNILVDDAGNPHVADFGLGLNLGDASVYQASRGGTAAYMSPEQTRHDLLAIDRRSDVWSLGIVLAELVHGRRPFPQKNRVELIESIESAEPLIESAAKTAALDAIVRRCLAKSPTDRFATAEILANELSIWLRRNFPSGWQKWRYGWRRNVAVALTCAVVCIGIGYRIGQKGRAEVRSAMSQMENAPADRVPALIARLRASNSADLLSSYPRSSDTAPGLRFDVASLATGDRRLETVERMVDSLQSTTPDEIAAIAQVLQDADAKLAMIAEIAKRLEEQNSSPPEQLRLAAALAAWAPSHPAWFGIQASVAAGLTNMQPSEQDQWLPLFDAVGQSQLADRLQIQMTSADHSTEVQTLSARALARYLSGDVPRLADLIMSADALEIPSLVEGLVANRTFAVNYLQQRFEEVQAESNSVGKDQSELFTRGELKNKRLAVGLWLLNDFGTAFKAMQHSPDPTLQTLVIHGLAEQRVAPDRLFELLRSFRATSDERRGVHSDQVWAAASPRFASERIVWRFALGRIVKRIVAERTRRRRTFVD